MALNFTKELNSEAFKTDILAINKLEEQQYVEFIHHGMQIILEPEKVSTSEDILQQFASTHGVNLSVLKNLMKTLLAIFKAAVRRNVSSSQLKEDMQELGLSQEKAVYLSDQWKQNLPAISHTALKQTLSVNQLVDMEWKFGVTASSSELNKVGSTFLQLKLVINKGNKIENVHMELSLPQFYSFLHEMEKAKSSLEYLT